MNIEITGEQVVTLVTLFLGPTSLAAVLSKRWADNKVLRETLQAKTEVDQQRSLTEVYDRLVAAAEKRETSANERTDRITAATAQLTEAVTSLSHQLTGSITDLSAGQKVLLEELRRANASITTFARENQRP